MYKDNFFNKIGKPNKRIYLVGQGLFFKDMVVVFIVLWGLQIHSVEKEVFNLEISQGGNSNCGIMVEGSTQRL